MRSYFEIDVNCPRCFNAVIDALSETEGVLEFEGHVSNGCLTVSHRLDESTVQALITSVGRTIEVAGNGELVMGQSHAGPDTDADVNDETATPARPADDDLGRHDRGRAWCDRRRSRPQSDKCSPHDPVLITGDAHMTAINRDQSLGQIVTEHPSLARELERRGLDYCCGGSSTLAQACTAEELDVATVVAELESLAVDDAPPTWSAMGVVQLVDHIEATHHRYLWDELPRLSILFDKVAAVHGGHHPELADSRRCFEAIRGDLEPHLSREEQRLFPMVRELAVADSRPQGDSGSVAESVSDMFAEHDAVGALLARLRELTHDYTIPSDGCVSYTALFAGLEALEADTHLHIHKENNLLVPTVLRLEQRLAS